MGPTCQRLDRRERAIHLDGTLASGLLEGGAFPLLRSNMSFVLVLISECRYWQVSLGARHCASHAVRGWYLVVYHRRRRCACCLSDDREGLRLPRKYARTRWREQQPPLLFRLVLPYATSHHSTPGCADDRCGSYDKSGSDAGCTSEPDFHVRLRIDPNAYPFSSFAWASNACP